MPRSTIYNSQKIYSFGMVMFGRSYSAASSYRFGFNGKEDDNEDGFQDYGMRMYNPELGRFFSVDPLTKKYPELSPYQFASNRSIDGTDLDGKEAISYMLSRFGGVGYCALSGSAGAGLGLMGLRIQGALGVAYDSRHNFALFGNTGGFADLFGSIGGPSNGGNPKQNGDYEMGFSIGGGSSEGYDWGYSNVLEFSGKSNTFSTAISSGIVYGELDINQDANGGKTFGLGFSVGIGAKEGLPAEVSQTQTTTHVLAFNSGDVKSVINTRNKLNDQLENQKAKDIKINMKQAKGKDGFTELLWQATYKDSKGISQMKTYSTNVSFKKDSNGNLATKRVFESIQKR